MPPTIVRAEFTLREWIKPGVVMALVVLASNLIGTWTMNRMHVENNEIHQTTEQKRTSHSGWHKDVDQARAETDRAKHDYYLREITRLEREHDKMRERMRTIEARLK